MKYVYKALKWLFNWIWKDFRRPKRDTHDFFEEDWDEYDDEAPTNNAPSIQTLSCPQCRHRGSFKIQVKEFLLMFHDYLELDHTQKTEWGLGSPCECPSCHFHGIVSQFQAAR